MTTVLVTGASGNVGREVVKACTARGLNVREASSRTSDSPQNVHLDFHDRSTWGAALEGVERLFLMRPPAIADVENNLNPFVDAAYAAGVDHIVFLSVAGAGENSFVPHRKVEDHLKRCGDHFTNLRPGFFAQNLQSAYLEDIREDDRIYVPAGRQHVNWIDVRDVADVAALVLDAPADHRGKDYTLAGPGPVSWQTVTTSLSANLGRTIEYVPASVLGYVWHLRRRRGLVWGAVVVQTILHFLLRFKQGATEDPTVEELLGRKGRSIETYIADHASTWKVDTPSA